MLNKEITLDPMPEGLFQEFLAGERSDTVSLFVKAVECYRAEQGERVFYSASPAALHDPGIIPDADSFVSPSDAQPAKPANGLRCSFESVLDRYPDRRIRDDFPPNLIQIWERKAFSPAGRCVLFFDSHVELVDEARFRDLLDQLDEAVRLAKEPPAKRVGGDKEPYIGFDGQNLTPELAGLLGLKANAGVLITNIRPGSPADLAGMRRSDVVQARDGTPIGDFAGLKEALAGKRPGDEAVVTVVRGREMLKLKVTLGGREVLDK